MLGETNSDQAHFGRDFRLDAEVDYAAFDEDGDAGENFLFDARCSMVDSPILSMAD